MATKADLEEKIELLREQNLMYQKLIENHEKEKQFLQESVSQLQQALIAKESPEAWAESRAIQEKAELQDLTPEQLEELHRTRQMQVDMMNEHLALVEGDTWKDADDMISTFTRGAYPEITHSRIVTGVKS